MRSDTPRLDKLFDMVAEREGPCETGDAPSKWSYEAILDLTDFARDLERENAALTAELAESARLHAMGSEREARLTARVAELERDTERLNFADKHLPSGITRQDVCMWNEYSEGTWDTSCGGSWQFTEDGPSENHAHFCYHCGGVLLATEYSDDFEDEEAAIDAVKEGA